LLKVAKTSDNPTDWRSDWFLSVIFLTCTVFSLAEMTLDSAPANPLVLKATFLWHVSVILGSALSVVPAE
jgi:hypothetical protein